MSERASLCDHGHRFWIRRSVFGWWVAVNPDEVVGLMDSNTHYRSFSREKLIEKMQRKMTPRRSAWEEHRV